MHVSSVDETLKLYDGKDTYQCDNALPRFCHKNYTYFKIIIISYNLLLMSGYICCTDFQELNFEFSSFRHPLVSGLGRRKIKKNYMTNMSLY